MVAVLTASDPPGRIASTVKSVAQTDCAVGPGQSEPATALPATFVIVGAAITDDGVGVGGGAALGGETGAAPGDAAAVGGAVRGCDDAVADGRGEDAGVNLVGAGAGPEGGVMAVGAVAGAAGAAGGAGAPGAAGAADARGLGRISGGKTTAAEAAVVGTIFGKAAASWMTIERFGGSAGSGAKSATSGGGEAVPAGGTGWASKLSASVVRTGAAATVTSAVIAVATAPSPKASTRTRVARTVPPPPLTEPVDVSTPPESDATRTVERAAAGAKTEAM